MYRNTLNRLLFIFSLAPALALAAPVAEVVGVRGNVTLVQNGTQVAPAKGAQVEDGAEIRTTAGRLKLRFIDGSVVIVGDNSVFRVKGFSTSGNQRQSADLALDAGLISQVVAKADGGSWTVRTPTVVTAVRGTEYIIDVESDATTNVIVRSGKVLVKPTNAKQTRSLPKLLKSPNSGVMCNLQGECLNTRQTSYDRLQALEERLSGL